MRLLACAGAAAAAAFGGLLMRRLYGAREAILTAALIALGPFFLVTASVGIYDAMTTGLVAAAVLVSLRLCKRPRLYTALLLGACSAQAALTKPTTWVAAFVLPFTLLLFDHALAARRAGASCSGSGTRRSRSRSATPSPDRAPDAALRPADEARRTSARRAGASTTSADPARQRRRSGTRCSATSRSRACCSRRSAPSSPGAATAPPPACSGSGRPSVLVSALLLP